MLGLAVAIFVVSLVSSTPLAMATQSGGWGIANPIENGDGQIQGPQVTVDSSGNAIAVWSQYDGGPYHVWANRYVVGYGWGTATVVENDDVRFYVDPVVGVDGIGNAIAVWPAFDGVRYNIWANRYVPGTGWGTATLIETDNAGDSFHPRIAVDVSGNAVAAWYEYDGARFNVWANRYVVGAGWGTATLIETGNGTALQPQVSADSSGNVIAVWTQYDGTRNSIWANRYVPGTGWGSATLVESDNSGDADSPELAVDGTCNAISVWFQFDGTRYNIWANRYVVGTGWGTAALIETNNADAFTPQVAVDHSGNAVAVWTQIGGSYYSVWANSYVVGTGWGIATRVETSNIGDAFRAQVVLDGSGNGIAIWSQSDGTHKDIWSNRLIEGTGWLSSTLVETDNAGDADSPQLGVDNTGNAIAVWSQSDSLRDNVWANRYVVPDTIAPSLSLSNPADGSTTQIPTVTVSGTTERGARVVVNGILVDVGSQGGFSIQLALSEGQNLIVATAVDSSGNSVTVQRSITYTNPTKSLQEQGAQTSSLMTLGLTGIVVALIILAGFQFFYYRKLSRMSGEKPKLDSSPRTNS